MADNAVVRLTGIDDLRLALSRLPGRLRKKALVKPLRAAGKVIQRIARDAVPVIAEATPRRNKGTVKRRIAVRTSRVARQNGNVGVFVGVRPLTRAQIRKFKAGAAKGRRSGANNPADPYFWSWLEFGHRIVPRAAGQQGGGVTTYMQRLRNGVISGLRQRKFAAASITGRRRSANRWVEARPFLRPAADGLGEALQAFEREAVPLVESLNTPGA